jgi:plastocyanin
MAHALPSPALPAAVGLILLIGLARSVGPQPLRAAPSLPSPARHAIAIRGFEFQPGADTVHVGDRVTWTNDDLVPHTATGMPAGFDSGSIAAAGSWGYVARRKGTIHYTCRFHPTMRGTLVVR